MCHGARTDAAATPSPSGADEGRVRPCNKLESDWTIVIERLGRPQKGEFACCLNVMRLARHYELCLVDIIDVAL